MRSARPRGRSSGNACRRSAIGRTIRRPSCSWGRARSEELDDMRLHWNDLGTPRADLADGERVEITGWPSTALPATRADYFHLTAEPNCCVGCLPANPLAVVEVFAKRPIELPMGAMRLVGRLAVLGDDPLGWRYQLRGAQLKGVTRRRLLAASPLVSRPVRALPRPRQGLGVDLPSPPGNPTPMSYGRGTFAAVAEPMRQGGMSTICLAIVADSPIIRLTDGRLRPSRNPNPGELYSFS